MIALGLAVAAGLMLYGHPAGLGVAVVAVTLVLTAPRRRWTWLALALAVVPAIRAAGWLQWMALGAAFLYAGGGPRALVGLVPGPFRILGPLVQRADGRWREAVPAARGIALAAVLLLPFAALFATADAAFAQWLESAGEAVPDLDASLLGRALIALAVLGVAGALMIGPGKPVGPGRPLVGRTEWIIALVALNGLFAAFVALQLAVLFAGDDYVLRTAGLTYAEYAREGFGQLVTVAALTLAVIAAARRWTEGDRMQLALLGGLCLLTLVILVSAWHRLDLYVDAFGMTRLRVLAQWAILTLAGAFLLLPRPRLVVGYAGVALLAFALSNPEGRIADRTTPEVLRTLSEDAGRCAGDRGLIGGNLARWRAQPCAATS